MYDVVTFGEALIRLNPPNFRRFEQATNFDLSIGGSELNIAVGAARLGLNSCWISRLPSNPLGALVRNKAREQGVDTSNIIWCGDERIGVCYLEFGSFPRPSNVIYDRKNSSLSNIGPGEVDWPKILKGAKVFMVSGITPALSNKAREVTIEAIKAAKQEGCKVSIDLNYRAKLWTEKEAQECMKPLMSSTDILMTTEEDTYKVLGIRGKDYNEVAKTLNEIFGIEAVAITLREDLSVWKNRWTAIAYVNGKYYKTRTYEVEIVDRVGAGDSFSAGFLYGYLKGDIQKGLDYGVAFSSLKHTHPGDFCLGTHQETASIAEGGSIRIRR